jgi:hypothetical protein
MDITPITPIDATAGARRERGGMVKISGKDRPDLIEVFDALRSTTTMNKGTIFAKATDDASVNTYILLDTLNEREAWPLAQATSNIKDSATVEVNKAERRELASKTPKAQTCICSGCGKPTSECPAWQ